MNDIQKASEAIAIAGRNFLKENGLITDGQNVDKLHAVFVHGARSEEARLYHEAVKIAKNRGKCRKLGRIAMIPNKDLPDYTNVDYIDYISLFESKSSRKNRSLSMERVFDGQHFQNRVDLVVFHEDIQPDDEEEPAVIQQIEGWTTDYETALNGYRAFKILGSTNKAHNVPLLSKEVLDRFFYDFNALNIQLEEIIIELDEEFNVIGFSFL